jgi:hypothetical protein
MTIPIKAARRKVPKFATEAEEAKWWDDHKEMIERNLIRAIDNGTVQNGTAGRLVREARASRNIAIRMAEADLSLARKQAEEKGRRIRRT